MTCPADLHTHTTASDGQYTPSQLAAKALAAGIQILAVTDHDTMDGAEEAVRAGQACGLTVLRGVELGAREDRHMHILGLNLGPECPALAELCRRLRASREERKYRIAAFLRGKGLDVPLEEVVGAMDAIASPVSLYEPVYSDGGDPLTVMDQVRDTKNTDEQWLDSIALRQAMRRLSEREKRILALRFYDGRTQMEVAGSIGISQAQVSRLEKNALNTIRKAISVS